MRIFDNEGPLMSVLNKLADLLWINMLTLLCCIPVVTAGAAMTAMHFVLLQIVRNEEGYLTRPFFKSFRQNFRQATIIWLFILVLMGVFAGNVYLQSAGYLKLQGGARAIIAVGVFLVLCVVVRVFPFLAKFENSIFNTVKYAFMSSIAQFPQTLLMMILYAVPPVVLFFFPKAFPVVFLFGISLPAYVSALLYNKLFARLEEQILQAQTGAEGKC